MCSIMKNREMIQHWQSYIQYHSYVKSSLVANFIKQKLKMQIIYYTI